MKSRLRRLGALKRQRMLTEDQRRLQLAGSRERERVAKGDMEKIDTQVSAAHAAQSAAQSAAREDNRQYLDVERYQRHLDHVDRLQEIQRRKRHELRGLQKDVQKKSDEVEQAWRQRRATEKGFDRVDDQYDRARQRDQALDMLDSWMEQQENDR